MIPRGVRDLHGPTARRLRDIDHALRERFLVWGYQDVVPATLERFEAQAQGVGEELEKALLKLVDAEGVLALRGDFTSGLARIVGTELAREPRPLRLAYSGSVFRHVRPLMGQDREFHQAGVELIGWPDPRADAEILALAVDCLAGLGLEGFRLGVGHTGLFRALLAGEDLAPAVVEELRLAVGNRDTGRLDELVSQYRLQDSTRSALLELPDLCGDRSVLDAARTRLTAPGALAALDHLERILDHLEASGRSAPILVDLGEVRGLAYYTGILFEGFVPGLGFPVLTGGRYDHLLSAFGEDLPAVGFAFILERLVLAAPEPAGADDGPMETVVLEPGSAGEARTWLLAAKLRAKGVPVILSGAAARETLVLLGQSSGEFVGKIPGTALEVRISPEDEKSLEAMWPAP